MVAANCYRKDYVRRQGDEGVINQNKESPVRTIGLAFLLFFAWYLFWGPQTPLLALIVNLSSELAGMPRHEAPISRSLEPDESIAGFYIGQSRDDALRLTGNRHLPCLGLPCRKLRFENDNLLVIRLIRFEHYFSCEQISLAIRRGEVRSVTYERSNCYAGL